MAIMGDNWKSIGVNVEPLVQTQAQNADKKFVASFPSFNPSQIPIKQDNILARVYGPNCAAEENRWNGSNRGCSQIASLDRVNDPALTRELFRDFNRILTQELPVLPLYFSVQVVLFR
jgi:ABC-type transport system substrate-binding protein